MACEHLTGAGCVGGTHTETDTAERIETDWVYRRKHFVAENRLYVVGIEYALGDMGLPV